MSVKEFFYEGLEIILQVYDEQGFLFKGIIFLDTEHGVVTERIAGNNKAYQTMEDAFQNGFEHAKKFVDSGLSIN